MFTENDIGQMKELGVAVGIIEKQIEFYKTGFPFMYLFAPATLKNGGINKIDEKNIQKLCEIFDQSLSKIKVLKFVPASGAASRMFKTLFSFKESYDKSEDAYQKYLEDKSFDSVFKFISEIKHFAFYNDLKHVLSNNNIDIDQCLLNKDFNTIIDFLLEEKGLNYASLPKALLKFHSYGDYSRTAFEEHLVEAASYSRDANNNATLHFTVSSEHTGKFNALLKQVIDHYMKTYNVKYDISFSLQKQSTNTIAVDMDNNPFREENGSLLFRPGGHGALLENLNDLDGDVIFIKNIDNIVPDRLKAETILYKKALAGLLLKTQKKLHEYLFSLTSGEVNEQTISEMILFAKDELKIPTDHLSGLDKEKKSEFLLSKLNRPIRVCGMVKNEGEPGGGPFWVKNKKGEISLQIVESSQIDLANESQKDIFNASTHFNPVDLVCGVRDFRGNKFNLMDFTDPDTGFISVKSKDGKNLKALELPGLWNGAMADWITIFVEVPVITFNPVKTINDLLRKEHQ